MMPTQTPTTTEPTPNPVEAVDLSLEWQRCAASVVYFTYNYVKIFSIPDQQWVPFHLWPFQVQLMLDVIKHGWVVVIKTRQVGFSWIGRAIFLWVGIFHPAANIVMFSKSDEDAKLLLSEEMGFKGMERRLPHWMRVKVVKSNEHQMVFENGTIVSCRPYTQAEGSTYSHCLIDEIDRFANDNDVTLVNNLKPALENAVINLWGSISDKSRPGSILKNTYRAAVRDESRFYPIFVPWFQHPNRNDDWYEQEFQEAVARTGDKAEARDWMQQQYPSSAEEAMAPTSQSKRIPANAIYDCYTESEEIDLWDDNLDIDEEFPELEELAVFALPEAGEEYVIGVDPSGGAGGNEAAAQVMNTNSGQHVATLAGKYLEPTEQFPMHLVDLAVFYNGASLLIERNNHGGMVLVRAQDLIDELGLDISIVAGHDMKPGWLQTGRTKAQMWSVTAKAINGREVTIADSRTAEQVSDIEKDTLKAAKGNLDDRAVAYALTCLARELDAVYLEGDIMF